MDNDYGTWQAWSNQYWPAKYLIDRNGHVPLLPLRRRGVRDDEEAIRTLLGATLRRRPVSRTEAPHGAGHARDLPRLQAARPQRRRPGGRGRAAQLHLPRGLLENELAFSGVWTVQGERGAGRPSAGLRLQYRARNVYLVLTGRDPCECSSTASLSGRSRSRRPALHARREREDQRPLLELQFSPGVAAYAFTFGVDRRIEVMIWHGVRRSSSATGSSPRIAAFMSDPAGCDAVAGRRAVDCGKTTTLAAASGRRRPGLRGYRVPSLRGPDLRAR
jgi:hypothetical protein